MFTILMWSQGWPLHLTHVPLHIAVSDESPQNWGDSQKVGGGVWPHNSFIDKLQTMTVKQGLAEFAECPSICRRNWSKSGWTDHHQIWRVPSSDVPHCRSGVEEGKGRGIGLASAAEVDWLGTWCSVTLADRSEESFKAELINYLIN